MKRTLVVLSPIIFILFAACGGGDDAAGAPPIPLKSELAAGSKEISDDMIAQINKLKGGDCEDEGNKIALILVAQLQNNQSNGQKPTVDPNSLSGRQNSGCDNLLNNIIWNASHIKYENNQPWINDPAAKMYLAQRLGALLNRIGSKVYPQANAAGIPPDQLLSALGPALIPYFRNVLNRVSANGPQGLANEVAPFLGGL